MNNVTPKTGTYDPRKAAATRKRRHANGQYVTAAQKAAFAHLMQRDGRKSLTRAECEALASHPHLTIQQRAEYAKMSTNWEGA